MGEEATLGQDAVTNAVPPRRRLLGLQYMRAVAATGVVVFHIGEMAHVPLRLGSWGVDLFFVLSGFLMIAITDGGTRPWDFFRDRFLRVVPLYWIATAALVMLCLVGLTPRTLLDPLRVAASFAFIPFGEIKSGLVSLPLLPVGWTLNLEMLFYTLFAFALFLPRRWQLPALTGVLGALVSTRFFIATPGNPLAAWSHPIILEFVSGGWVAMAWLKPERRRLILACLVATMVLWAVAWPSGRKSTLVTLVLMATLFFEARGQGIPKWRPLLLLGDASYSIYLWQFFPMLASFIVGNHFGLPTAVTALVAFVTMMGGGIIAYFLLERPLLKALHRRPARRGITIPAGP